MIVIDSSSILAILLGEPEKDSFEAIIAGGDRCVISAFNAHETVCVMRGRHGAAGVERLWRLLEVSEIEIVPFDNVQVRAAAAAFDRYGKGVETGTGPRARLNMADCAAYALAKTLNAPLLFKGNDFSETDIKHIDI